MTASPCEPDRFLPYFAEAQQAFAEMGPEFSGLTTQLQDLLSRFQEGRIRLAVVGQFKRGKSSLLNALLGEEILPTGVLPLTAIPTVIQYAKERRVHIYRLNGRYDQQTGTLENLVRVLKRSVTERENPANRQGIDKVTVELPSILLAKGVEIIDTPGIGSTILHNTQIARATVPRCDVAIFVLSPDPPITEAEVQFVRAVKDAVARVIFVMNKADLLPQAERSDTVTFLQRVLHEQAGFSNHEPIFLVSARQALEGRLVGNTELWHESGMATLESYLTEFLVTEKRTALSEAVREKVARLIGEALFAIELERNAIELPRQELERRSELFEAQLAKIESERMYCGDRLAGDRHRLSREMDQLVDGTIQPARKALVACVEHVREEAGPSVGFTDLERRLRAALRHEVERIFGQAGRDVMASATVRFQSIQDTYCRDMEIAIDRVRRTAADLFEVPCLEGVTLDRLETVQEPRVMGQRWISSFLEEAASWFGVFLPPSQRAMRLDRRVREDIDYLVTRNIEDLRWVITQNLGATFGEFQARLEGQIDMAISAIRSSIRGALKRQIERESRKGLELDRLDCHRLRLKQILAALSPKAFGTWQGGPV